MEMGRMAIKRNKLGLSSVFKNLIVSASGSAVFEARCPPYGNYWKDRYIKSLNFNLGF